MKYILVVIAGASDEPTEAIGSKTPFELAKIPNLNYFTKAGRLGKVNLTNSRFAPSSDVTFMNLLGYPSDQFYTGRGPLEAANLGIKLEENEVVFRANFVTEAEGLLADSTGGYVSTKEARALINFLNKKVASDFVRFYPGEEYRHVAVIKDSQGLAALSARTTEPNDAMGEPIESNFPEGPGDELLKKLMLDTRLLLKDHEINQVRIDLQENPSNMVWFWGQGRIPELENFEKRYEVASALITGVEFAKGVAKLSGIEVFDTGTGMKETEDDYELIGDMVIEALEEKDFVCVYINACDEASRTGSSKGKIGALEATDYFILSKIKRYLEENKETRVLVTPSHVAPWETRNHVKGPVPFALCGKGVAADDIEKFSETTMGVAGLSFEGGTPLMDLFFSKVSS